MKKLFFAAAIVIGSLSFKAADAQISISVNIGSQPDWGPTGYNHVDYYYLPDIDCYYDVPNQQYIYNNGSVWTRSSGLPPRYSNFDLYNGYKVVVNEARPWTRSSVYRNKYASFKGHHNQPLIRDSHDSRYKGAQQNRQQQQGHQQQQGRSQQQSQQNNRNNNRGQQQQQNQQQRQQQQQQQKNHSNQGHDDHHDGNRGEQH